MELQVVQAAAKLASTTLLCLASTCCALPHLLPTINSSIPKPSTARNQHSPGTHPPSPPEAASEAVAMAVPTAMSTVASREVGQVRSRPIASPTASVTMGVAAFMMLMNATAGGAGSREQQSRAAKQLM